MNRIFTRCLPLCPIGVKTWLPIVSFVIITLLSATTSRAEISNGLHTGEDASTFADISLPASSTSNTVLKMETLWEMDMSQANGGNGANDANGNNHNLFLSNGELCVYVETYTPAGICLRKFNPTTGTELGTKTAAFPDGISYWIKSLVTDDVGNLVLIANKFVSAKVGGLFIKAITFDSDLKETGEISCYHDEITSTPSHHFMRDVEWQNVEGDVSSGNFKLNFGAYHYYCKRNEDQPVFLPSICSVNIHGTNDYEINVTRIKDGALFSFDDRPYNSTSYKYTAGLLSYYNVSENITLAQAFGTIKNPLSHSPILLLKRGVSTDNRWAEFSCPVLDQVAALTDEEFKFRDSHCFGVFPVKVGDEQLLVLPYKFNSDDGVKFKVAHWGGDHTTFDHLTELWQFPTKTFPSDCAKVFGTNNQNIYDYARPKVVVAPTNTPPAGSKSADAEPTDTTPKEAIIYAYMPGALLGAYKISLVDNAIPSNIISQPETDGIKINFNHQNQIIEVTSDLQNDFTAALYTLNGIKAHSATILPGSTTRINLNQFVPGVYLLKVKDRCEKIIVK